MMKQIESVIYSGKVDHLSKLIQDLPDKSVFNKVLTGCGGTTVAMKNDVKYVICVPFKSLIDNKAEWARKEGIELLIVHGDTDTTDDMIRNYMGKKIMVTYDSLPRIINNINPADWKLLVDESHKLVDSGVFRYKAIDGILDNFNKFGSYVFMTATPVKDEYQLPALRDIPKSTIEWTDITPVNVKMTLVTGDITKHTALLAMKHLEGSLTGNAHIFINSVNSIINAVEYLIQLNTVSANDVKIVCANNSNNQARITKALGPKYKIDSTTTFPKNINFYTSTAFEGHDIYDKEAVVYVITDGSVDTTKINILTTLPQIVNRIRDAKTKNTINLLFSSSEYFSHTSEAEYASSIKRQLDEKQSIINVFNENENTEVRQTLIRGVENDEYIREVDGKLVMNSTIFYNKMHSFSTINNTYYVKDESQLIERTVVVNSIPYNREVIPHIKIEGYDKLKLGEKANFKSLCLTYLETAFEEYLNMPGKAAEIAKTHPIIKDAYEKLGEAKMKALGYREKNFREALTLLDSKITNSYRVVKLMELRVGQWISTEDATNKLQSIYDKVGIKQKAKGTDLKSFYEVAPKTGRNDEGKPTAGFRVISEKLIRKSK